MTIYLLTCGSIFLLAFILITNPGKANRTANGWLGFFIFSMGCALLAFIASQTELQFRYPYLIPLTELTRFAMAPSIYLCILFFTYARRTLAIRDYLHFIPAVLFLLFSLPYLLRSMGFPEARDYFPLNAALGIVMSVIIKVQVFVYWILSFRLLLKHRRNVGIFASSVERIDLRWLKYLLWSLGCMILLWYNQVFNINTSIGHFTGTGYLVAIYLIGYFSLKQKEIFPYKEEDNRQLQVILSNAPVPRVSEPDIANLKAKLEHLMVHEKLFTDSELSLPALAGKMGISVHQLSYVLNKGYEKNFFQYINHYRVELAKELLHSDQHRHLSILGIAFEAGFTSKTTFNTTFKKATGVSPSTYQESRK